MQLLLLILAWQTECKKARLETLIKEFNYQS